MAGRLIDDSGKPRFGIHESPVDVVNFMDYDLRTPMDRRRSRLSRRMGFNQFQFIGMTGPDWCGGLAIVDLKWLALAFVYIYDVPGQRLLERTFRSPLSIGARLDNHPDTGPAGFHRGAHRFGIEPRDTERVVTIASGPDVSGEFRIGGPGYENPLRVCSPAGYQGWTYTQKWAGLGLEGRIRWGGRVYEASPDHFASVDWSCGFMRRETAWNWACLSVRATSGEVVGLNLATGINESGVLENALWVDGRLEQLGQARFRFERYDHGAPWHVTTRDGRVDLSFFPLGHRAERVNAGLVASNFRQFFGYCHGSLVTTDGQSLAIDGSLGLMEDHYARW